MSITTFCVSTFPNGRSDQFIGRQVESVELVPGDVYEVSDPSLTQFPCDSLLLAGDCIVNESMLTGIACSSTE